MNLELAKAYDTTLEGWSRALELRDQETKGHSSRVTDLTITLAKAMGIDEGEMDNIRRGALLHDVGKMGIPDNILLKPGPLTDEEREIIQKHTLYSEALLKDIPYLKAAMAIPMYHHERWDGLGYPHGLKGKDIPLSARIFAIIDQWDALISDRPYREAWSEKEALDYLENMSGIVFDPIVVKNFLEIIQ